ncbi:phospholipase D-like domain-containing protein [Winogradskyella schleiferi]|uniref:phospholipase D-like domain-containing protein n=1 Tax=Winogradskyella schleiferi TaxID=2686078 RepID=UPI0015BA4C1B|nr:phospholipase D-like domain-containing protein [Winogradskyella schleiferi]
MIKLYFDNIESEIIKAIIDAENSIKIAVAWFTNKRIYNALLLKLDQSISIEIIIRDDSINNSTKSIGWDRFIENGGKLYFFNPSENFHHKFFIVDTNFGSTGSYNWTNHAESKNEENVVFVDNKQIIQKFTNEFDSLKLNSIKGNNDNINVKLIENATEFEREYIEKENNDFINGKFEFAEAQLKYNLKEYSDSINLLNKILESEQENIDAISLLGWCYLRLGKNTKALTYAFNAYKVGMKTPECLNLIGCSYSAMEDYKNAIKYFDFAIEKDPNTSVWYKNKMNALDCRGSTNAADKVEIELTKTCSQIIRNKEGVDSYTLMKTYIDFAETFINRNYPTQRKYANYAKEIFENLDENFKDFHDLDDIEMLLNNP